MDLFYIPNDMTLKQNVASGGKIICVNYEVELCSISLKTEPILSLSTSFRQLI